MSRESLMKKQQERRNKKKKDDKKNKFNLTIKKYDIRDKEARKTKVNPKEIARRAGQIKDAAVTGAKWFKKNITDKTKNTRISSSQPVGSQTKETKTGVQPSKKQQQKTTTKAKSKSGTDLASLKKKLKRHASGKNSVAKTKLKLKIRKLEGK